MAMRSGTSVNFLAAGQRKGIYNTGKNVEWWLASPAIGTGGDHGNVVLYVYESSGYLGSYGYYSFTKAVRPLVCFRTSVFNDTYTLASE